MGPEHSFLQEVGRAEYFAVTGERIWPGGGSWAATPAGWRGMGSGLGAGSGQLQRSRFSPPFTGPSNPSSCSPSNPLPPRPPAPDEEALEGFQLLSKLEGIIPALETSHAIAYLSKLAPSVSRLHGHASVRSLARCVAGAAWLCGVCGQLAGGAFGPGHAALHARLVLMHAHTC